MWFILLYLLQTFNQNRKKENCATIIKRDKIANLRHLQKCIYTKEKDAFKYKITQCKKNPWPTHSNKCTYLPIKVGKNKEMPCQDILMVI